MKIWFFCFVTKWVELTHLYVMHNLLVIKEASFIHAVYKLIGSYG